MNSKKLKQSKDFQENYFPDTRHSTFYESFKKTSTTHQKQSSLNSTAGKSARVSKLLISSEKMKGIKYGGSPKINKLQKSVLKESKICNKTAILEEDNNNLNQQSSNSKIYQAKNYCLNNASPLMKQNKKQSSKQLLQSNFDEYFKENNPNSSSKMKKKNKSLGNLFEKKKQITTVNTNNNNSNNILNNVNPTKSGQDLSFEQMAQYFNNMGLSNRNSAINNSNTFSSINVKKIDLMQNKSPQGLDSTNFLTSRNNQNSNNNKQQQSQQSLNFKKSQQEEEGQEFSRYFKNKQYESQNGQQESFIASDRQKLKKNLQDYKRFKLFKNKCKKENKKLSKENYFLKQKLEKCEQKLTNMQQNQSQYEKVNNILSLLLEFNSNLPANLSSNSSLFCLPVSITQQRNSFILKPNDFHYFPEKILGRGGFGEVYLGKLYGKQDCAVKILKVKVTEDQLKFLQGELIAMIVCEHPNLVKLHGVCIQSSESINQSNNFNNNTSINLTVSIVMELLITDLRKLVFKQAKIHLNKKQKYRILLDILKGLSSLHSTNYVHCDLKMQNILLDSKLNAKISDFGLSKRLGQGKTKQTITGGFSERNSAFEYLVEDKVSTKGDIWSFGILMYELLSEKIAWGTLTGPQTVAKVSIQTPFYSCNQKIGDEADLIIEHCLNYDHQKRPSADMLIQAIHELAIKL